MSLSCTGANRGAQGPHQVVVSTETDGAVMGLGTEQTG